MTKACDAPCILVRVVVTEQKAISNEINPQPVFCGHDGDLERESERKTKGSIAYLVKYTMQGDFNCNLVILSPSRSHPK
jgi:hypothetical protein